MKNAQFHEDFSRENEGEKSSERSFGLVFSAVCALVGGLSWYHDGHYMLWLIAAAIFLVLAYFLEAALRPLNRLWLKIGDVLFAITNPIIMGVLFFGTLLPTGIILRLLGKDPMRLKRDPAAETYWVKRDPPGPAPHTMTNQF